jgi:hypothetical protein
MQHDRPRPLFLLLCLLAVLAAVIEPARSRLGAVLDVFRFQSCAEAGLAWPPRFPLEYPPLSLVLFLVPQVLPSGLYLPAFAFLAALTAWGTLLVTQRLGGDSRMLLVAFVCAWCPLFFRMDVFVVLPTVLAYWATRRQRWWLAQGLLGIGVALKLYPIVLIPLVVLAQWRATRRLPWQSALGGVVVLLLTVGSWVAVAPEQGREMLSFHQNRPLEFESTPAVVAWLLGPVQVEQTYGSVNLATTLEAPIRLASLAACVLLLLVVYAAVAFGRAPGAVGWMLVLLVLIATSKVFSTQYILWVLPFVVLAASETKGLSTRKDLVLWMLICLLTTVIYPLGFAWMKTIDLLPLVAVRNLLWLSVCGLWLFRCASQRNLETTTAEMLPQPQVIAGFLSFNRP